MIMIINVMLEYLTFSQNSLDQWADCSVCVAPPFGYGTISFKRQRKGWHTGEYAKYSTIYILFFLTNVILLQDFNTDGLWYYSL